MPNGAHGDTIDALNFEQHIFSTICGMIRSRAYQLNNQAYPSDSNFFRSYTITLGSPRRWNGAGVRRIIDSLRFKCGPTSNQRADVQWVEHRCFIHHLPRDNSHILQLLGRSEGSPHDAKFEDRATVQYMGEIYKFEFHEFQKQQRHDPTLTLQNVQFLCEGPSNAGQGLVELRNKWDTMWDASTIHPHGRSRAGHLSGAEGLQGGLIHQHGERVISSAGHPIVVGKWPYDPIRPSGVEERLHGPMYPRDGGVRSKAAMPMHPRDVPGRHDRQYDSHYPVQDLPMRQTLYQSDLERTGHDKFWDELRSNPRSFHEDGYEEGMADSHQLAGGGGETTAEVVHRSGLGYDGNGGGVVPKPEYGLGGKGYQWPRVLNQVRDENRQRGLEHIRLLHGMDANAGVRSDMVGPHRRQPHNTGLAHGSGYPDQITV
jgi:hypothetical protein